MTVFFDGLVKQARQTDLSNLISQLYEQQMVIRQSVSPSAKEVSAQRVKAIVQVLKEQNGWPFVIDQNEHGAVMRCRRSAKPGFQFQLVGGAA